MVALSFRYESGTDLRVFATVEAAYTAALKIMGDHGLDDDDDDRSLTLEDQISLLDDQISLLEDQISLLDDQISLLDEWNENAFSEGMEIVIQEVTLEE